MLHAASRLLRDRCSAATLSSRAKPRATSCATAASSGAVGGARALLCSGRRSRRPARSVMRVSLSSARTVFCTHPPASTAHVSRDAAAEASASAARSRGGVFQRSCRLRAAETAAYGGEEAKVEEAARDGERAGSDEDARASRERARKMHAVQRRDPTRREGGRRGAPHRRSRREPAPRPPARSASARGSASATCARVSAQGAGVQRTTCGRGGAQCAVR